METNAYTHLRTCLRVFEVNIKDHPEARLAIAIIRKLMDRIGVEMPNDVVFPADQTAPQQRPSMSENAPALGPSSQDSIQNTQHDEGLQWNIGELDFDQMLHYFENPRFSPTLPEWPGLSSASVPGQGGTGSSIYQPDDLTGAPVDSENFFDFDTLRP